MTRIEKLRKIVQMSKVMFIFLEVLFNPGYLKSKGTTEKPTGNRKREKVSYLFTSSETNDSIIPICGTLMNIHWVMHFMDTPVTAKVLFVCKILWMIKNYKIMYLFNS